MRYFFVKILTMERLPSIPTFIIIDDLYSLLYTKLYFKYPGQVPQTPPLYELVLFLYDLHQLHEKSKTL